MSGSPYGDQTAGKPVGPYGNQTAGKAVGPYAVHPRASAPGVIGRGVRAAGANAQLLANPEHIRATQKFLHARGYNIAVDGKWGPQTRAALADWHKGVNKRNPGGVAGSSPNLLDHVKDTVVKATKGVLARPGHGVPHKGGKGGGHGFNMSNVVDLSGLAHIAGGAGVPIPGSLADQIAGGEFDPQIHDLSVQQARQPLQGAQDLQDIGHWYDQVLGSEATARSRDSAASAAGVNSIRDAVAKIVGSLGGSANQGAGLVGAAGADQVGSLEAQGVSQDQYNNDIRPLLREQAAGARSRQVANNEKDAQDIAQSMLEKVGARGQKKGETMMTIREYNNSLKQQGFQNRLALEQAKEAAMMSGLKVMDAAGMLPGSKSKAKLPKGAFANTTPSQKAKLYQTIVSTIQNPNGQLNAGWTSGRAAHFVDSAIRGAGWTRANPQVEAWRNNILRALGLQH